MALLRSISRDIKLITPDVLSDVQETAIDELIDNIYYTYQKISKTSKSITKQHTNQNYYELGKNTRIIKNNITSINVQIEKMAMIIDNIEKRMP